MNYKTLILPVLTLPLAGIHLIAITPLPVTAELLKDTSSNLLLAQNPCPENPNLPCRRRGGRNPAANITIISPTRGSLLNNKPTISWFPISGATSYSVRIEYSEKILWEKIVENQTEILYPSDKAPLELDNDYEVIVETIINDKIKSGRVIFRLPNQAQQQSIQTATQNIANSQLTPDDKAIQIAEIYKKNDFLTAAIQTLNSAIKNESENITVYQMLGDLYIQANLPKLAETPYQKALNLAGNLNDRNSQAEIQLKLGKVYDTLDKSEEVIASLTSARASYQSLNKLEFAARVAQYLGEFYEEIPNRDLAIQWYETAKTEYESLGEIERANIMEKKLQNLNQ
ncbi:MAG TPA: hypothetical protein DEG17_24005 [Cyanobacteria bacterium UBA11149]|nr:hypothetical protein [Cyanobacteria bacterium UBA11367]HBE56343.1 hypothetical protein [Cyanobacteria bacterium UBA11366]HBK65034.1 hypothetical protein [Cyanobacteria bacterium UBA11166]HBR76254.1 hypothetical protein [Cyanobacteria bacterium UBA11159]HBS70489.1 hypothetical protein [Cyanobacteria bacterium UBA11153]HBW91845.1 hypothetical protein [Cyanobacteria bacterium UBA11149]HCA94775.1 hypothetical protein [Cyanobacteria bacterium UBA9226]